MKRAAAFGRAPVIGDVELAMALLGYDGSADDGFAAWRARAVHDAAHHYTLRRAIVDSVPDAVLARAAAELGGDDVARRGVGRVARFATGFVLMRVSSRCQGGFGSVC